MSTDPAPRWGVSSLDYHTHAIDEDAEHPYGVYVARCGQWLFRDASLYDEPPPGGSMCPPCLRSTERRDTGEVREPPLAGERLTNAGCAAPGAPTTPGGRCAPS